MILSREPGSSHRASWTTLFLRRRRGSEFESQILNGAGGCVEFVLIGRHVIRRPPFDGNGVCDLRRLDHLDRVPWTPALAQIAADTAIEVDVHETLQRQIGRAS